MAFKHKYAFARVEGAEALARALKKIPGEWTSVRKRWQDLSAKTIVEEASDIATRLGSVAAKAAEDLRALSRGQIVLGRGTKGTSYYLGAEFGAKNYKQFMEWRGNKEQAGYFLYPTYRKFREEQAGQLWLDEAKKSLREAFPEGSW